MKISRTRRVVAIVILLVLVGIIVVIKTQLRFYRIISDSMYPTLRVGDFVCVDTYELYTPERGDVIVLSDPTNPDEEITKRVIGLPGDLIEVRRNYVLINGVTEVGHYLNRDERIFYKHTGKLKLEEGNYFVLGDNRNRSFDSMEFGSVSEDLIIGKVKTIYWPPSRMGKVK